MSRMPSLTVLSLATVLMFATCASDLSAGRYHHHHHRYHGHYTGTYYPAAYYYGYSAHWGLGYPGDCGRWDYAPYTVTGVPFSHATAYHGTFAPSYSYAGTGYVSPGVMMYPTGFTTSQFVYQAPIGRPIWTSAHYGTFGYSSMGWHGWHRW